MKLGIQTRAPSIQLSTSPIELFTIITLSGCEIRTEVSEVSEVSFSYGHLAPVQILKKCFIYRNARLYPCIETGRYKLELKQPNPPSKFIKFVHQHPDCIT